MFVCFNQFQLTFSVLGNCQGLSRRALTNAASPTPPAREIWGLASCKADSSCGSSGLTLFGLQAFCPQLLGSEGSCAGPSVSGHKVQAGVWVRGMVSYLLLLMSVSVCTCVSVNVCVSMCACQCMCVCLFVCACCVSVCV